MKNKIAKTIWCDQDGVLAEYEHHAYKGTNPIWLKENHHYFRHLKPDIRIIQTLYLLQMQGFYIQILTNITDIQPISEEHISDKIAWIKEYMPFINTDTQFHTIQIPKAVYAKQQLKRQLETTDILISDYNKDLSTWTTAGGTAIKYLNGLNSPHSFQGEKIYENMTVSDITEYIKQLKLSE